MNFPVEPLNWPPLYTVRRSLRARYASLRISAHKGLEVILPKRYQLDFAIELINQKRPWIEKHRQILPVIDPKPYSLPQEIYFNCVDEHWKITYLFSPGKTRGIINPDREFILFGEIDDHGRSWQILQKWLFQKAEQILLPRLFTLSQELGLSFQQAHVRKQKTRWGSCSSQKKINLNYQLIFLTPDLVRHVMIHELCHTRYLNHSKQFWQLVASYDPDWQSNRRRCRQVEIDLPQWLNRAPVNFAEGC